MAKDATNEVVIRCGFRTMKSMFPAVDGLQWHKALPWLNTQFRLGGGAA